MSEPTKKLFIAVAGQDVGTCQALSWAAMSIEPFVIARSHNEIECEELAIKRVEHSDIHIHRVR